MAVYFFLSEFLRGKLELFFEVSGKRGIITKTALIADFSNLLFGSLQQLSCHKEPFAGDILVKTVACISFEFTHKIEFT